MKTILIALTVVARLAYAEALRPGTLTCIITGPQGTLATLESAICVSQDRIASLTVEGGGVSCSARADALDGQLRILTVTGTFENFSYTGLNSSPVVEFPEVGAECYCGVVAHPEKSYCKARPKPVCAWNEFEWWSCQ